MSIESHPGAPHHTMGSPCSRASRSARSAGMEGGRKTGRGFTESMMPSSTAGESGCPGHATFGEART